MGVKMSFWTVCRTHPNAEKIAIRNLQNQDFDYYQPKIMERKLRKQKLQMVEAPLFPNYLFVKIVNKWLCLQSTHGIAAVLSAGPLPSIVKEDIIDSLRNRELNGYIQLPRARIALGSEVTIKAGAFAGHQALVERMPFKDRQKVLLALLSSKIKVLIDEENLEAA